MIAGQPGAGAWGMTRVHAAGSLRAAFSVLGDRFERQHRQPLTLCFGAAGLLKNRLAAGEPSSLFASANLEHPQALVAAGHGRSVLAFARNQLCLLVAPGFAVRGQGKGQGLGQRLLDADVRVGTSTPGADPSGDYAWRLFDSIEASGDAPPGSAAALKAKALQLTGSGDKPPHAGQRSLYATLLAEGHADVFVTYRTNASQACADDRRLRIVALPATWAVQATYGLAVLEPAPAGGQAFAALLRSGSGQAVLREHGFSQP